MRPLGVLFGLLIFRGLAKKGHGLVALKTIPQVHAAMLQGHSQVFFSQGDIVMIFRQNIAEF